MIRALQRGPAEPRALARLSPARSPRAGSLAAARSTLARLARTHRPRGAAASPDDGLVRLGRERGFGPWTVGVVALEGLGRYDAGLVADLGLVKLLAALRGPLARARSETAELLAPYGEWQGLASVFLLAGFKRGLVTGASPTCDRRDAPAPDARLTRTPDRLASGRRLRAMARRRARSRFSARDGSARRSISGLLSSGWREPAEIAATARRAERVAELRERHGIDATLSNHDAIAGASLVVIAVKPQDIEALLGEIGALILPEQTVLSVAAAIPTARIEARLRRACPVVRAMPNTPVDRARGDRRALRRGTRRRRAPRPRRGGAVPPRRRRPRPGVVAWTRSPRSRAPAPPTSRSSPRR